MIAKAAKTRLRGAVLLFTCLHGIYACSEVGSEEGGYPEPIYLHVREFSSATAGLVAAVRVFHLETDGLFQLSSETHDGQVFALSEYRFEPSIARELLRKAGDSLRALEADRGDSGASSEDSSLIREHTPEQLRFDLGLDGTSPLIWTGGPGTPPPAAVRILDLLRQHGTTAREQGQSSCVAYIRAEVPSPVSKRRFVEQGLVLAAAPSDLATNPTLSAAVRHPYRLVALEFEENPFRPFWERFRPGGPSLKVSVQQTILQVRSLACVDQDP